MSYILEALRKAEAQRGRQRLPGLQAQPLALAPTAPARAWGRSPWWGAVGLAGALVASAAWWVSRDPEPVAQVASGRLPGEPGVSPPKMEPPTEAAASVIVPAPPKPVAREEPARALAPAPAPVTTSAPTSASASAAAPAPVREQGPPAGAPSLAITGGVYSPNPAQRMLIVNGQVFNEGSEVAAGVTLEQVRPNQAVLNFRGERYTVRY